MPNQPEYDKEIIRYGEMIQETLNTQGWKKVVKPLLDKMIEDVVGGKIGERWNPGSFGDKRLTEAKAQNLLWYRQALIEFNNHVQTYIDAMKQAKDNRKKEDKKEYILPMLSGKYHGKIEENFNWRGYSPDEDGGLNG